jgi:hypothetical protein
LKKDRRVAKVSPDKNQLIGLVEKIQQKRSMEPDAKDLLSHMLALLCQKSLMITN